MNSPSKIVLKYLMDCVNFDNTDTMIDRVQEISEGYETVPDSVLDAYQELSSQDKWEIIRKIAVKGKGHS